MLTDAQAANNLADSDIAYISCLESDYQGLIRAAEVFSSAASRNPAGIVLYNTQSSYCNYTSPADNSIRYGRIYTMTMSSASRQLADGLRASQTSPTQAMITLEANATEPNNTATNAPTGAGGNNNNNTTLGQSPTTAVAMIILYSITGVITALFLIIIITGAVRAHRHPERYGPRIAGNGRTRQSRAKGIARAMLDTLPIVKFGEREEPKPGGAAANGDVEMGTTGAARTEAGEGSSEARPGTSSGGQNVAVGPQPSAGEAGSSSVMATAAAQEDEVTEVKKTEAGGLESGVAKDNTGEEEEGTLGCSICTEDFVKGEDVRVLPCNHKYHPECIDPWLLNVSGTCPLW